MSADGGPSFRERIILALTPNREAATQFAQLLRNPVGFILTVIVAQILGLGSYIVGSVLLVFEYVTGILGVGQQQILRVLDFLGASNIALIEFITTAATDAIQAAGPAGPPLAVGIAAVLAWLTWEGLKRLPIVVWRLYNAIPGT